MRHSNGNVSGHNFHMQYSAAYHFYTTTPRVKAPLYSATPLYKLRTFHSFVHTAFQYPYTAADQNKFDLVSIVIFLKTGKYYKHFTSFNSTTFTPGFNNILLAKF